MDLILLGRRVRWKWMNGKHTFDGQEGEVIKVGDSFFPYTVRLDNGEEMPCHAEEISLVLPSKEN